MWRASCGTLKQYLKYILKLLNNMHGNGDLLKDKAPDFCCLTIKKFKEEEFNTKEIGIETDVKIFFAGQWKGGKWVLFTFFERSLLGFGQFH